MVEVPCHIVCQETIKIVAFRLTLQKLSSSLLNNQLPLCFAKQVPCHQESELGRLDHWLHPFIWQKCDYSNFLSWEVQSINLIYLQLQYVPSALPDCETGEDWKFVVVVG